MSDSRERIDHLTAELDRARGRIAELESEAASLRRCEDDLRESVEKYSLYFSIVNDVIYSYDPDFTLLSVSPNVERLLGYSAEELVGKPFHELGVLDEGDLDRALKDALHVLNGGTIHATVYRFVTRDGRTVFGEVSGTPLLRKGMIEGVISVARDITRRIDLEKSFREEAEKYLAHFSLTSDVLYAVDAQLVLKTVSPSVKHVLNYSPEELIGRSLRDLDMIHPEDVDRAASDALRMLSGDKMEPSVYRFITRAGEVRYGEVKGIPLMENGSVAGVVAVARDVTGRVMAQEKIRTYQDRLEDLVRERTAELIRTNESLEKEIGERARTEDALRVSEARYRLLYEGMEDAFVQVGMDGRIQEFNPAYPRMLGYDPEDLHTLTYLDITPSRWHAYEADILRSQTMVRGYSELYEKEYARKDGTIVPIELRTYLVRDAQGQPSAMWAIVRDITGRKKVEMALRESERRFRDLAENTSDLIWETDEQLRFTYMSQKIVDHLGYGPEDRVGRTLLDVIPREDSLRLGPFILSLMEQPRPFQNLEYTALHQDGSVRIREASGVPIYDSEGRHVGYRGVTRDITERRKAEDRLRDSEAKYRFVAEKMSDIVWTMDLNLRTTYVSPSVTTVLGYTPEERVLQEPRDQLTEASYEHATGLLAGEMEREGQEGVDPERMISMEVEYIHKDGSTVWMENVISGIRDEHGTLIGLHGVSRDITDRKRAEEQLLASEKKFAAAFHSSPAPMVITSPEDGTIIDANQACQEWSGYTLAEAAGRTTTEMGFWQDPGKRTAFIHVMMEKGAVDGLEMEYTNRGGEARDVLHSARLIEIKGRQCLLSHIQDITEKNRAEKALRESEERLRGMANNFPGVVFQFYARDNKEMGFYYLSERTINVMGLENDTGDFLDRSLACISPEDLERFRAAVGESIRAESAWDFACRFTKPGGKEVFLRGISQPVRHAHELVFSGVLFDVTQQKLLDEELRRHKDQLEEMVLSRTSELTRTLQMLTDEIEIRKKTEKTLRYREMELKNRSIELEEMNAALKVLLKQRDEDRSTMEMNVLTNMKTFILPHIERLEKAGLEEGQIKSLSMLRSHLEEITSPFTRRISSEFLGLTPAEIQVASLIRDGKSSKEIARILNISINTVHTYRFNIRKKTGVKNNKVNLRSFLKTLE